MHRIRLTGRHALLLLAAIAALAVVSTAPAAGPNVVKSLATGFGLTGGGTGDVVVAVDTTAVQRRVSGTCAAGNAIRAIDESGAATCEAVAAPVASFVHRATAASIPESDPGLTIIDN